MHEEKSNSLAVKLGGLLKLELQMVRSYRQILPRFSGSPFSSLLAIMILDHERSARDLRVHVDAPAMNFVDRPALPFQPGSARGFDPGHAMNYIAEQERNAIRECENILDDEGSPEGLLTCVRTLLVPRLENHIAVLGIMAS